MVKEKSESYMVELFEFLKQLRENNNREWFNERKSEFLRLKGLFEADIDRLIGLMSHGDPSLRGLKAKDCVYRIYRDIRFKLDKTPYKTYFSAVIGVGGRKTIQSSCYLQIEPGSSGLYAGIWCPEAPLLRRLREEVDANIEEFEALLNDKKFKDKFAMCSDSLKTMPKGFPKDSPNAYYLKMKEYTCKCEVPDSYFTTGDWVEKLAKDYARVADFNRFLNYVFETE